MPLELTLGKININESYRAALVATCNIASPTLLIYGIVLIASSGRVSNDTVMSYTLTYCDIPIMSHLV